MTTKLVSRCSVYERRPKVCVDYPRADHYMPPECTYQFIDGQREGDCSCDVGACCRTPRERGEPGGAALPTECGGLPCRHLVTEEIEDHGHDKTAAPRWSDMVKKAIGV